jgi:hypothetical protein
MVFFTFQPQRVVAQILDNFNAGITTTSPNGYVGETGSGWTGAFSQNTAGNVTLTASIGTGNANLNSDGNYLNLAWSNVGSAQYSVGVQRAFTSGQNGVNTSSSLQYSFNYVPLGTSAAYAIFDSTSSNQGAGSGGSDTWQITDSGGDWALRSGASTVVTSMAVVQNDVYAFTIDSNPSSTAGDSTYTVVISNLTTPSTYTSTTLSYRNTTTTTDGSNLYFSLNNDAGTITSDGFDLSNLVIMSVPEPSTFALMLLGAGCCVIFPFGRCLVKKAGLH